MESEESALSLKLYSSIWSPSLRPPGSTSSYVGSGHDADDDDYDVGDNYDDYDGDDYDYDVGDNYDGDYGDDQQWTLEGDQTSTVEGRDGEVLLST